VKKEKRNGYPRTATYPVHNTREGRRAYFRAHVPLLSEETGFSSNGGKDEIEGEGRPGRQKVRGRNSLSILPFTKTSYRFPEKRRRLMGSPAEEDLVSS